MKTKPIMLPSDKATEVGIRKNSATPKTQIGQLAGLFNFNGQSYFDDVDWDYQHIYLVSDDEIKEGDWCIKETPIFTEKFIVQAKGCGDVNSTTALWKKIIASTDKSLNLPYLDLSMDSWIINYYNKNGKLPEEIKLLEWQSMPDKHGVYFTRLDGSATTKQPTEKLYTRDEVIAYTKWLRDDRIAKLMLNCMVSVEETGEAPTPEYILDSYNLRP